MRREAEAAELALRRALNMGGDTVTILPVWIAVLGGQKVGEVCFEMGYSPPRPIGYAAAKLP